MTPSPQPLPYDEADVAALRGWVENGAEGATAARRAKIVLLSVAGHGTATIAEQLNCSRQTVTIWRERYRARGIAGLADAPRSGRPVTVQPAAVVLRTLDPPPQGAGRWTTRLLAADLGISNVAVANIWRTWGMVAAGGAMVLGTEPALTDPATEVTGLHVSSTLRLLAVQVGAPRRGAAVPVPDRPDPGDALAGITSAPRYRSDDHDRLATFLDHLSATASAGLARMVRDDHPVRLLAAGAVDPVRRWARTSPGVAVHTVPPHLSWVRIAQVACLAAAARDDGARSVAALLDALADRPGDGAVSWLRD